MRRHIPAAHMTHFEKLCVSFKILSTWNSLAEIKPQHCVQIMFFVQRSFSFLVAFTVSLYASRFTFSAATVTPLATKSPASCKERLSAQYVLPDMIHV